VRLPRTGAPPEFVEVQRAGWRQERRTRRLAQVFLRGDSADCPGTFAGLEPRCAWLVPRPPLYQRPRRKQRGWLAGVQAPIGKELARLPNLGPDTAPGASSRRG